MFKNPLVRRILAPTLLAASVTTATVASPPPAGAAAPANSKVEVEANASEPQVFTPELIIPRSEPEPEPAPEPAAPESAAPAPAAPPVEAKPAPAPKPAAKPKPAVKAKPAAKPKRKKAKRWVLPVRSYVLTGRFGRSGARWASTHTGLDFAAPKGTRIRSVGSGKVIATYYHSAYGNMTIVRHKTGTVFWYCHQNRTVAKPGQNLKAGDTIGRVGSTGNSTGPHMHLEVHQPKQGAVNPERWLRKRGLNA